MLCGVCYFLRGGLCVLVVHTVVSSVWALCCDNFLRGRCVFVDAYFLGLYVHFSSVGCVWFPLLRKCVLFSLVCSVGQSDQ